jgi:hypothetical protein
MIVAEAIVLIMALFVVNKIYIWLLISILRSECSERIKNNSTREF